MRFAQKTGFLYQFFFDCLETGQVIDNRKQTLTARALGGCTFRTDRRTRLDRLYSMGSEMLPSARDRHLHNYI